MMDYQEIVTIYKTKGLATNSLKKRLDAAKPLKGRASYRALSLSGKNIEFGSRIVDTVRIPEKEEKLDSFRKQADSILEDYFDFIINSIKECKAWSFMQIKASNYSKEKFLSLDRNQKFKMIYELNEKYYKFLEYQKIADIRDSLGANKNNELSEDSLKKLAFLKLMFNNFKNKDLKNEVFCFNEEFLIALVNFKKSKFSRLDEYFESKKRELQFDFKKYTQFFKIDDLKDLAENIELCSKTSKFPVKKIIKYYYQLSESDAEQVYLKEQMKSFRSLEKKTNRMERFSQNLAQSREREKNNRAEFDRRKAEIEKKHEEEIRKNQSKQKETEPEEIKEKSIVELEEKIAKLKGIPTAKELVVPIIFYWFERGDFSITQRLGSQKVKKIFERIKQFEKNGARASLYFVTNANKEITSKRYEELKGLAQEFGMPKLVEGALGSYGAFRIDEEGKLKEISEMSEENKEKIKFLLENVRRFSMTRNMLDTKCTDFLRYKFSDGNDKSITPGYITSMMNRILDDRNVKRQPLKFYLYSEKGSTGIDVLLKSQVKSIMKIPEYYDSKYYVKDRKLIKLNIDEIDSFFEEKEDDVQETK